jgi:hypothetical protein
VRKRAYKKFEHPGFLNPPFVAVWFPALPFQSAQTIDMTPKALPSLNGRAVRSHTREAEADWPNRRKEARRKQ